MPEEILGDSHCFVAIDLAEIAFGDCGDGCIIKPLMPLRESAVLSDNDVFRDAGGPYGEYHASYAGHAQSTGLRWVLGSQATRGWRFDWSRR